MNGESNKKVRLFMKMRNNGGTKKDPCETPAVTPVQAEKVTPVCFIIHGTKYNRFYFDHQVRSSLLC